MFILREGLSFSSCPFTRVWEHTRSWKETQLRQLTQRSIPDRTTSFPVYKLEESGCGLRTVRVMSITWFAHSVTIINIIVSVIIKPSFYILLNCLYLNPSDLLFPLQFTPISHQGGGTCTSFCVVLSCQVGLNHNTVFWISKASSFQEMKQEFRAYKD